MNTKRVTYLIAMAKLPKRKKLIPGCLVAAVSLLSNLAGPAHALVSPAMSFPSALGRPALTTDNPLEHAIGVARASLLPKGAVGGSYRATTGAPGLERALSIQKDSLSAAEAALRVAEPKAQSPAALIRKATNVVRVFKGPVAGASSAGTASDAAREIVGASGLVPNEDQLRSLRELDQLPSPLSQSLGDFLWAFVNFQSASRQTYGNGGNLDGLKTGFDPAVISSAQLALLDAAGGLRSARLSTSASVPNSSPVDIPGAIHIDLRSFNPSNPKSTENLYSSDSDYKVLVDAAGNDAYYNNAGGNHPGGHALVRRDRRSPDLRLRLWWTFQATIFMEIPRRHWAVG